jgi:hypothetical protein
MPRQLGPRTLVVLLTGGACVGIAYSYLTRPQPATGSDQPLLTAAALPAVGAVASAISAPVLQAASVPSVDPVATWIEDAAGEDPGRRVVAITALGGAPAARALPVLRQVLGSGDSVDRPLALNALRELALKDGDATGSIREMLRVEVYDGTDEAFVQSAQALLTELDDRLVASR